MTYILMTRIIMTNILMKNIHMTNILMRDIPMTKMLMTNVTSPAKVFYFQKILCLEPNKLI